MDDRTYSLLQELANQIGTTVEFIWPILVRQAFLEGITGIVLYVSLFISIFIYIRVVGSLGNWKDWSQERQATIVIAGIILAFIAVFPGAFLLSDTITRFINPEYHALETILQYVK